MRPVDKGADQGPFVKHEDAQQPLLEQLGEYCSYCERWIASAIHVEHKKPKHNYPAERLQWSNFLLSCSNCNSGKGHGQIDLSEFVWPDTDNTLRAFQYDAEGRVFAKTGLSNGLDEKVRQTWLMLGFNRHPDQFVPGMIKPTKKDHRWLHRRDAWRLATRLRTDLVANDTVERRASIIDMAIQRGMFSVWMAVFANDADICRRLIAAFPGTAVQCFDAQGQAVARPGGQI